MHENVPEYNDFDHMDGLACVNQGDLIQKILDEDTLINYDEFSESNNDFNIQKILDVKINDEIFPELIMDNTNENMDFNNDQDNPCLFPELNHIKGNSPIHDKDNANNDSNNNQFADQKDLGEFHNIDQNNNEDIEETKSFETEEFEYSKPGDINLEQPQKKKEMIPIELIMQHINSMIMEKNCGIVRKDIKRKIFKLATSLLGNPKGNIPEVLLREYEKSYFLDSEKESNATGLKWLAGDLKKTRLQSKRANLEELERYKNTPYEIEKEVLEGIIDTLTLKENKPMKNAKNNLKKFQRKRLIQEKSDVSSNISAIETDSDKNHPLKFTEYSPEWEKKVYNSSRKEEFKGKTKEHVIAKEAIDNDMEDIKNKRREEKVISKKNKRKQKDRICEPSNLPKENKGRKFSRQEKKENKTKKREAKKKEKEVRLQNSDNEENNNEITYNETQEEIKEIENPTIIESSSDMESVIEYEDGPQYIKERESQISDHYVGPNPQQAIPVEMNSRKLKEQLKQWEKIEKFMNEEREIFERNQVQESLLLNSENKRKIENRIKKIPESHFDLHSHKESFRTDFIEFKNEKCDEMGKDHIFFSKKSLVFIQAGTEHRLQFCFNICGLLSVLNSKVATLSHLKLFNALLEMFAMHNPCLPIERALQSDIHDRDIYLRGDKQKDIKKENKRIANKNYQPQRKKLIDQRKQEKNKKGIEELKEVTVVQKKVDDNQNEDEESSQDYNLDGFNPEKMVEDVDGIKSLIEDVYKKVLNEEETTDKHNYREMTNKEFRDFMRK